MERSFIGMAENSRATAGTIALLTLISILGQLSIGLYTPSLPSLAQALSASAGEIKLTMTVFLASFAVAQLFWGAFSDRFGRRPILFAGVAVYLAGTIICLTAGSIDILIAGRFIQGIGACVGITISRAVVRDRYDRAQGARTLAFIGMAMAAGPAVAPVLGGQLQVLFGWRSAFAALLLIGAGIGLATYLRLDESIRQRDPAATDPVRLMTNYGVLLRSRIYIAYSGLTATFFGGLMAFATGAPFVMIDGFGMSPALYGFMPLFTVMGYFSGSTLAGKRTGRDPSHKLARVGAGCALTGGAAFVAVTLLGVESPATVIAPMVIYMFGYGLALPSALAAAMQPFAQMAGTAAALQGFAQMAMGAIVTLIVAAFADGSARSMTLAVAAASILVAFFAWLAPAESKDA